jgi:hypothetical protein
MPKLLQYITALVLIAAFSSCATAKFQPGKPVTHGGPFNTYVQGGERVSYEEVQNYLVSQPDTEDRARQARTWKYISIVPALTGGFLIGYNLATPNRTSDTGLWIGVGLATVGIALGIYSDSLMTGAVDTYNQGLVSGKKTSENSIHASPWIAPQTGTAVPAGGLSLALGF